MKTTLLLFISLFYFATATATEQSPDILFYNAQKFRLNTGWGHPSPLEAYYQQNGLKYPFRMLSTANYRGFIATWKIEDGRFYITNIDISGKSHQPKKFNVVSKDASFSSDDKVFADWFNGVVIARKPNSKNRYITDYSMYFYIKGGIVIRSEKITEEDITTIQKSADFEDLSDDLQRKYEILYLNQSYISYYFRSHDDELITINSKVGKIRARKSSSIILEYFNNDHLQWPYNWENQELNGAPNGVFEVIDNKLYVMEVNVHTGLNFEAAEIYNVPLNTVFKDTITNTKLIASWLNGVYMVVFEEEVEDEILSGYKRSEAKEFMFLRLKNGEVLEQHTVSKDFNFQDIPEDTDEGFKKMYEDFRKQ